MFDFPKWPVARHHNNDVPPPPPLGPYMSSALNDMANAKIPGHAQLESKDLDRGVKQLDPVIPSARFSPDMPWPGDDEDKQTSWLPSSGYQYVPAAPVQQYGRMPQPPIYPAPMYSRGAIPPTNGFQRPVSGSFFARPNPRTVYQRPPVSYQRPTVPAPSAIPPPVRPYPVQRSHPAWP